MGRGLSTWEGENNGDKSSYCHRYLKRFSWVVFRLFLVLIRVFAPLLKFLENVCRSHLLILSSELNLIEKNVLGVQKLDLSGFKTFSMILMLWSSRFQTLCTILLLWSSRFRTFSVILLLWSSRFQTFSVILLLWSSRFQTFRAILLLWSSGFQTLRMILLLWSSRFRTLKVILLHWSR